MYVTCIKDKEIDGLKKKKFWVQSLMKTGERRETGGGKLPNEKQLWR